MKFWVILLFLGFGFCANAQEIKVNGTTYEVKGKIILKDGVDVTNTLTIEQQNEIRSSLEKKLKVEKEAKNNDDKKLVTSVILNRLNVGMKLQIDASTIFAITGGNFKLNRKLTNKAL